MMKLVSRALLITTARNLPVVYFIFSAITHHSGISPKFPVSVVALRSGATVFMVSVVHKFMCQSVLLGNPSLLIKLLPLVTNHATCVQVSKA
jgi:hypothetical protein